MLIVAIWQSKKNKLWYLRGTNRNNRQRLPSEGYRTKYGAERSIRALVRAMRQRVLIVNGGRRMVI